jgi:glucose/arabinose dehydrogenase
VSKFINTIGIPRIHNFPKYRLHQQVNNKKTNNTHNMLHHHHDSVKIKQFIPLLFILSIIVSIVMSQDLPIRSIEISHPNFSIKVLGRVNKARQLAISEDHSVVFIGSTEDSVSAILLDVDSDGRLIQKENTPTITIASGLLKPNGVAIEHSTGDLYIAEYNRISKIAGAVDAVKSGSINFPTTTTTVRDMPYPDDNWHSLKYIKFFNKRLYVPIGIACNVCDRQDPYATINSFDYTQTDQNMQDFRVEARGVRNSVGFHWSPSGELWFTDNGRDELGNDTPGDELNKIDSSDSNIHFGFPFCHDVDLPDPDFNPNGSIDCSKYRGAMYTLGPHVAALGMIFTSSSDLPEELQEKILIAEHGSWNRDHPIGYRITIVDPNNSNSDSYQIFAQGWLQTGVRRLSDAELAWGRPVDILQAGRSFLVSDDKSGTVYTIFYDGESSFPSPTPSPTPTHLNGVPSGQSPLPSEGKRESSTASSINYNHTLIVGIVLCIVTYMLGV